VLLVGLGALIAHTERIAATDAALAFRQLKQGAVIGSLLTLSFAGIAIALVARRFLVKPAQHLGATMARAEMGDFLVRARVTTDDELGRLARSFNTMLARVTDMAVKEIETRQSLERMEREVALQRELQEANARLAAHVRELELLVDAAAALSGTLDLPEQLERLGQLACAALDVREWTALLLDGEGDFAGDGPGPVDGGDASHLVVEAVAGAAPEALRGMRFALGEGICGLSALEGRTLHSEDVSSDPRYLHYKGARRGSGSFLSVPLRAKGRTVGVMNLSRGAVAPFTPQDIRLAEAIAAQAALAIANARLYRQTLELSNTDPLTGIPNRRQVAARLEQEVSRSLRFGDELSVLMIDVDLFKHVNDAYGHAVGDSVLRGVALALQRNLRKVDMVGRYGGEEFVAVLPRIARAEAVEVAEKLRGAVASAPIAQGPGGQQLTMTISVGVATFGHDATDAASLLAKADAALYEAKRAGRDRVVAPLAPARVVS
jgi:diguanylate cyclase (GGDEF)-like protein